LLRKCKFICLIPKNPSVPHFQWYSKNFVRVYNRNP
jgi:hypothetical protein